MRAIWLSCVKNITIWQISDCEGLLLKNGRNYIAGRSKESLPRDSVSGWPLGWWGSPLGSRWSVSWANWPETASAGLAGGILWLALLLRICLPLARWGVILRSLKPPEQCTQRQFLSAAVVTFSKRSVSMVTGFGSGRLAIVGGVRLAGKGVFGLS